MIINVTRLGKYATCVRVGIIGVKIYKRLRIPTLGKPNGSDVRWIKRVLEFVNMRQGYGNLNRKRIKGVRIKKNRKT